MATGYVLILEDNVLAAMEIEDELLTRGHVARCATHLAEAEAMLDEQMPWIALLDVRLPDGVSHDLARRLQAAGCPLAFISGVDSGAIPDELRNYPRFPKPVGAWVIADWIDGCVTAAKDAGIDAEEGNFPA
jgi:hypothetical protein